MRRVFWFLALFLSAAVPAAAQPAPPERVGRVSLVSGTLAFRMAGEKAWSAAGLNYPVATGASFWSAPGARAQVQLGPNTLALDAGSTLDVTELDAATTRLGLGSGRLDLHIRAIEAGQSVEIDLPTGSVSLLAPGEYDIAAGGANEPAHVAVFAGRARFVGEGADIGITAGNMAVLLGEKPVTAQLAPAAADAFVAWCRAHDYRELAAPRYVSPEMSGYAALAQYGSWARTPEYGEVWYPRDVPADWAPYRFGEWAWIEPWGWTWIDAAPWGFAPFHYGRWAYIGGRWGWVPGQIEPHPVYAPALVAFLAGIGVGWFPLAPGEAYWPSYTTNLAYVRRLNQGIVKDAGRLEFGRQGGPPPEAATAKFSNRRFATVVPRQVFERAGRVDKGRLKVEPAKLEQAPVQVTPPKVAPVVAHPMAAPPVPAKPVRPGVAKIAPPQGAPPKPAPAIAPHPPGPPAPAATAVIPPAKKAPPAAEAEKKAREEALRQQQEKARALQQQQQQQQAIQAQQARQRALEEQQRAAQQRAFQQQQQQQAIQAQQARQRALEEQKRAAQQRAIQQQQQQQRALQQQQAQRPPPPKAPPPKGPPPCGHPGEPPCPH
jgi:hypothetical protein